MPPPGEPPPTLLLTKGWNLVGVPLQHPIPAEDLLQSLPTSNYFGTIFVWDSSSARWDIIVIGKEGVLKPGQAFWIYMYKEEVLIPYSTDPETLIPEFNQPVTMHACVMFSLFIGAFLMRSLQRKRAIAIEKDRYLKESCM